MKKAYWIEWKHMPEVETLTLALTAGKARYFFLSNLLDHYPGATFQEVKVRRAPEFDSEAQGASWPGPISLGWVDRKTGNGYGIPVRQAAATPAEGEG